MLYLITGPPGAGKSTYGKKLAAESNSILFSIDDWMGQLFAPDMRLPLDLNWIMPRVQRCEDLIWSLAADALKVNANVILDLGLIKATHRQKYLLRAAEINVEAQLHFVTAPKEVRMRRVLQRNKEQGVTYAFTVTPEMFAYMDAQFEEPSPDETFIAK